MNVEEFNKTLLIAKSSANGRDCPLNVTTSTYERKQMQLLEAIIHDVIKIYILFKCLSFIPGSYGSGLQEVLIR